MANRENSTFAVVRESEPRLKAALGAELLKARNIAVQALASNADANDPSEILAFALSQLADEVLTLQDARRGGLREDVVDVALIRMNVHIEALAEFAETFLGVEFKSEVRP
jgi:hypothetical protein